MTDKAFDPEASQFSGLWDLAQRELKTVRDCLRFAVSRFNEAKLYFGHGSNNAYDEAAYLILETLHLPDLCASFQEAVAETLVDKTVAAALRFKAKDIVIGGGVAANSRLRALMTERGVAAGFAVRLPARVLCTDNAAMIAHVAWRRLSAKRSAGAGACDPALPLRSWK